MGALTDIIRDEISFYKEFVSYDIFNCKEIQVDMTRQTYLALAGCDEDFPTKIKDIAYVYTNHNSGDSYAYTAINREDEEGIYRDGIIYIMNRNAGVRNKFYASDLGNDDGGFVDKLNIDRVIEAKQLFNEVDEETDVNKNIVLI